MGGLLGFLALLPWFLGLFFFLLLGLLPGAVLFRFADPIRPVPAGSLWFSSIMILLAVWLTSAYAEYLMLPRHMAVKVRKSISGGFPEGYTRDALDAHIAKFVAEDLRKRYGSSGPIGYMKWASGSGRITFPAGTIRLRRSGPEATTRPVRLQLTNAAVHRLQQPALLWCIRVVVSFLLLILALAMQIAPLRKAPVDESEESETRP